MNQKAARSLRRETKRTLGNHLQAFIGGQKYIIDMHAAKLDEHDKSHATFAAEIESLHKHGEDLRTLLELDGSVYPTYRVVGRLDELERLVGVFNGMTRWERLKLLWNGR